MKSDRKNILLTGATGFIGGRLLKLLSSNPDYSIVCSLREKQGLPENCDKIFTNISSDTDWSSALQAGQVIVHLAARAHITKECSTNPLEEFRQVNVEGTLNLARQAAQKGAKRFVFLSSIGVNGKTNSQPFTELDEVNPTGPYAQSKWEAEKGLWDIHRETGLEVVIIRPPLVYGLNAPGNFGVMAKWLARGLPLPLGSIRNKRSLVSIDNLVGFIGICIESQAAANQLFLVSDNESVSTTELLRKVGGSMGRPARLLPFPEFMLKTCANLLNKKTVAEQLLGSLQVDNSKAKRVLGWEPSVTIDEGLKRCFREENIN